MPSSIIYWIFSWDERSAIKSPEPFEKEKYQMNVDIHEHIYNYSICALPVRI